MKWISVKDKSPEDYQRVLFVGDDKAVPYPLVELGYFVPSQSKLPEYITHWMPLPEPPKP